ncbi:MAG: formylglycine-generating enzyme family protein [Anaerolineae bacterium]
MEIKNKAAPLLIVGLLVILSGCAPESAPTSVPIVPSPQPTEEPAPTPVPASFDTRGRDGMTMVYVPAGQFEMGCSTIERARPVHTVAVDAFWIDQTEVTNAMFAAFLSEQGNQVEEDGVPWLEPGAGHRGIVYGHIEENDGLFLPEPGYENYPVVEVSWYGAAAYCAWAGGRLPTEAEWEYAARGPQASVYPWGDTFDGGRANFCDVNCTYKWRDTSSDDGFAEWTSVGSYPDGASWCGALDMAGNVWEWVQDWWSEDTYARSPGDNPQGPEAGTLHVARGGSWFDEGRQMTLASRTGLTPSSYRMHWVGFRCVMPA